MDEDGFPTVENTPPSNITPTTPAKIDENDEFVPMPTEVRPESAQSGTTPSGNSNSQTSNSSKTDLYSKSQSYDSSSYAQETVNNSFPSYKTPSVHGPEHPYACGAVFPGETDDDLTSDRSEDYSYHHRRRQKLSALEEIQLDVLGAVQELARSASSGVRKSLGLL